MEPELLPLRWLVELDDRTSGPLINLDKLQSKFVAQVGDLEQVSKSSWSSFYDGALESTKVAGSVQAGVGEVTKALGGVASETKNLVKLGVGLWALYELGLLDAAKAASQYRSEILLMNQSMDMNGRQMGVATGIVEKWWATLGYTREEVIAVVREGLQLGTLASKSKDAAENMRTWADETLYLARATGESTAEIGKLYNSLTRIHGVPDKQLYRIGSAIKYVGDETVLTHGELVQLVDSQSELLELARNSGTSLVPYTQRLLAVAGALGQGGIAADGMLKKMTDLLDLTDEQGLEAIEVVARYTRRGVGDLRKMITDSPDEFVKVGVQAMQEIGSGMDYYSQMRRKELAESLGVSREEALRMARFEGDISDFVTDTLGAGAKGVTKHRDAAHKTVDDTTEAYAKLDKELRMMWIGLGEVMLDQFQGKMKGPMNEMFKLLRENRGLPAQALGLGLDAISDMVDGIWDGSSGIVKDFEDLKLELAQINPANWDWSGMQDGWEAAWEEMFDWVDTRMGRWLADTWSTAGSEIRKVLEDLGVLEPMNQIDTEGAKNLLVSLGTSMKDLLESVDLKNFVETGERSSSLEDSFKVIEKELISGATSLFSPETDQKIRDAVVEGLSDVYRDVIGTDLTTAFRDPATTKKYRLSTLETLRGTSMSPNEMTSVILSEMLDRTARRLEKIQGSPKGSFSYNQEESILNPKTNVRLGAKYLADLIKKYDGNTQLALMAYNWGMGNLDKVLKSGKLSTSTPGTGYARDILTGANALGANYAVPISTEAGEDRRGKVSRAALKGSPFDPLYAAAAQEFGLSEELIRAVAASESYNNPNAKSRAGAYGLMQLKIKTAEDVAKKLRINLGTLGAEGGSDPQVVWLLSEMLKSLNKVAGQTDPKRPTLTEPRPVNPLIRPDRTHTGD